MSFSFTDVLLCLLIFQLGFVCLFLLSLNRGKRVSNSLLGSFFGALGLNLLDTLLLVQGVYFRHPAWGLWGTNLALLYGPLLWLHTQSVIYRDFRLRGRHALHALPFVLLTVLSLAGFHAQSAADQQQILRAILDQQLQAGFYVVSGLIFAHFFAYLLVSLRLVRRYKRALNNQFSAVENKNLGWLSSTLGFLLALFGVSFVQTVLAQTPWVGYRVALLMLVLLGLLWFTNRFLLRALRSPDVFLGLSTDDLSATNRAAPNVVAPGNVVAGPPERNDAERQHAELLAQLTTFMQTKKPYLNPELTLDELAEGLGVRPKQLSAALNDGLGQHFFDYVNRYRVDEARRILAESSDPKLTVLEVMYDVGFNSKSSFNTLFRKYTGQTPSAVKRKAID